MPLAHSGIDDPNGLLPSPERKGRERPSESAVQLHLAALRAGIDDALCSTALTQQCLVFRSLSDIVTMFCLSLAATKAVYDTRQSCLDYFDALERGTKINGKKRAAQISVDLLEATLLAEPAHPTSSSSSGLADSEPSAG